MTGKTPTEISASEPIQIPETVVAVVVTHNRLSMLPQTLSGISAGELLPDRIVIVDNASDDGTREYLDNLASEIPVDVVHLAKNVGGSGGMTVGLDRALVHHSADLIWMLDGDTEPNENSLSELYRAWAGYGKIALDPPALVASRVVQADGLEAPNDSSRIKFSASEEETKLAVAVGARPIRSASFISVLLDAAVVRREGLPLADFVNFDGDFEYSTRLINHRVGIATAKSVVLYHANDLSIDSATTETSFYNDVRNKLWVITRRRNFSFQEKASLGADTARNWARSFAKTAEKTAYARDLKKGISDGARGFRTNREVLSGVYELEFPGKSRAAELASQDAENIGFSVLMATFRGEKPEFLEQAIASNTVEQTRRPDELVLVQDGPVPEALEAVIEHWKARGEADGVPLKLVELERNLGLARALDIGLEHVSHSIVARADSDDISLPERFELQLPAFLSAGVSVLGGSMEESDASGTQVESIRHAVIGASNIAKAMVNRNPVFHPTVMFDVRDVQAVGGYEFVPGGEDYWLWARLVREGYKVENIDVPLVRYRAGAGAFAKRGGFQAIMQDFDIQSTLYRGYIISPLQYSKNMAVRLIYRSLPTDLRAKAFRKIIGGARGAK